MFLVISKLSNLVFTSIQWLSWVIHVWCRYKKNGQGNWLCTYLICTPLLLCLFLFSVTSNDLAIYDELILQVQWMLDSRGMRTFVQRTVQHTNFVELGRNTLPWISRKCMMLDFLNLDTYCLVIRIFYNYEYSRHVSVSAMLIACIFNFSS